MKPILFNTEMVRAILEGRKTVTRRIIKLSDVNFALNSAGRKDYPDVLDEVFIENLCDCRYAVGDILYVRETWGQTADLPGISEEGTVYAADFSDKELAHLRDRHFRWRPSIHMPKNLARLFLKVKTVQAERLWDMVFADVLMEGITEEDSYTETKDKWRNLWDSTIPKADLDTYGWKANPWVWAIQFEVCEKPGGH